MRKILLLTALILGYFLPTFSQLNNNYYKKCLQNDVEVFNNIPNSISLRDSNDITTLSISPTVNKYLQYQNLVIRNQSQGQNPNCIITSPQSINNMPCIKPQGFFPMPVHTPDSSLNHTLLIKKK